MTIMQGDSYPLYFDLSLGGEVLTPDLVAEMEICFGEVLRKLYSAKEIMFEKDTNRWYIWPTQEETLAMPVGALSVIIRMRYNHASMKEVQGYRVGTIKILDTYSEEVI